MSFNIIPTDKFQKEAERLSKQYSSLKSDLEDLNQKLLQNLNWARHSGMILTK